MCKLGVSQRLVGPLEFEESEGADPILVCMADQQINGCLGVNHRTFAAFAGQGPDVWVSFWSTPGGPIVERGLEKRQGECRVGSDAGKGPAMGAWGRRTEYRRVMPNAT